MTTTRPFYDSRPVPPQDVPQKDWPTMYDLPSEYPEEPGLPDVYHDLQPQLLSATLQIANVEQDQIFTGTDLNIYYDREHPRWHKRPDWFLVTGVPHLYAGHDLRLSYVIWDEQVSPSVVVELISPGTAASDLGQLKREPDGLPTKWQVYEEYLQIPYYIVYDRYEERLWFFKLIEGQYQGQYQAQDTSESRCWLASLGIGLGLWQGEFQGITRPWLRWYDAQGEWMPTDVERERQRAEMALQQYAAADERAQLALSRAEAESQRAEAESQKAEAARQRAEQLAERLRELGINPDEL
jgi:Uma2 family endonuclease